MMPAVGMLMRNDCARSGNKPTMTYSEVPIPKAAIVSAKMDFRMSLKSPTQINGPELIFSSPPGSDPVGGLDMPWARLSILSCPFGAALPRVAAYTFLGLLP